MSEYNLCSLLVHAQADKSEQVKHHLQQQDGVEVHADTGDGRLIVTIEAQSRHGIADQMMDVQKMHGVYSAAMIYQFSDDIELEPSARISA